MRLNLYWRGRDVLDIEAHVWKRRPPEPKPKPEPEGPALHAAPHLADTAYARDFGPPDTVVFGFCAPPSVR